LKILTFIIILSLFFINPAVSQTNKSKWQRYSGKWNISDSKAHETNGWAVSWNYYEILDHNSVISLKPFNDFTSLGVNAEMNERMKTPSEFMISFGVTSESKSWFYHMYAFKFSGGFWGMNKVAFIHSDRLDKTKPFNAKNNTFVKELASAKCKVKYDKMYNYRIAFEGTNVALYINDEKILSAPFPEKSRDGRIAISSRNVKIAVDKVEVKQGDKTVFEDDFNEDSIYVKVMKVRREPAGSNGESKKPE